MLRVTMSQDYREHMVEVGSDQIRTHLTSYGLGIGLCPYYISGQTSFRMQVLQQSCFKWAPERWSAKREAQEAELEALTHERHHIAQRHHHLHLHSRAHFPEYTPSLQRRHSTRRTRVVGSGLKRSLCRQISIQSSCPSHFSRLLHTKRGLTTMRLEGSLDAVVPSEQSC